VTGAGGPPQPAPRLGRPQKARLLLVAADSVARALAGKAPPSLPDPARFDPALREHASTFVTLERDDQLLGCIGSLEPDQPLVVSVARHALAAAFSDPRLPAVTVDDFPTMTIKVSHLGPLEAIDVHDHDELATTVRPGRDGLVVDAGGGRATLLPSVWPQVGGVSEMLDLLWAKARLPRGAWPPGTRVSRYATIEFADPGPRPAVSSSTPAPD
jgi:uncharacterized protein